MKEKPRKPLHPYISLDEIAAYRSDKPETHTKSILINAVCEALEQVGYNPRHSIAEYLEVDAKDLTSALRLVCGYGLRELRLLLVRRRLETIKQEHPDWNTDQMAQHLGFADRSALFRILGEKEYLEEVAKYSHWHRSIHRGR